MFDLERFVSDCKDAVKDDPTHKAVSEIVTQAMADPSAVLDALGEPTEPGIETIYQSDDLTIVNLAWKPTMILPPHNHEMWAVIGIYGGREDNIFWRRIADDPTVGSRPRVPDRSGPAMSARWAATSFIP